MYLCAFAYKRKEAKEKRSATLLTQLNAKPNTIMILKKFRKGWQEAFEKRLSAIERVLPDVTLKSAARYKGMLRVKYEALDKDVQMIVDCVTYKIERDSAIVCEGCGKRGKRTDEFLPEKMCFCWKCHALEVEQIKTPEKD